MSFAPSDWAGKMLQRFDYYPSGSESRVWTAGISTTQSALLHRFGGKDIAGGKAGTAVNTLSKAASAGRPYLDFGARLYDPRTAAWLSQDHMAEKYYGTSPYAYCAGNPVNLVDPEGLSLAWVPRVNPATGDLLGFDWVDDEMIALDDGSLPEGVYHQAIFLLTTDLSIAMITIILVLQPLSYIWQMEISRLSKPAHTQVMLTGIQQSPKEVMRLSLVNIGDHPAIIRR